MSRHSYMKKDGFDLHVVALNELGTLFISEKCLLQSS